jgi:4-amino-4-deoxy-L-arabinose transferase-like glycosyltransferase
MIDLLVAFWVVFAACGMGLLLTPRKLWPEDAGLRLPLGFALGAGVLIGLTWLSGMTGTLHGIGRWGILPAATVAAAAGWKRERSLPGRLLRDLAPGRSAFQVALSVVLALLILKNFLAALTPEVRHDAIDYHIQFPSLYAAGGRIADESWSVMSYLPFNMEMLYTLALLWGRDTACKLLHFSFGVFALVGITGLGRRWYRPRTGLFAAVLFAVTPQVARISMTSFNDLAAALFATLSLALWFEHWNGRSLAGERGTLPGLHLVFAALMMGLALGVKWSAFPVLLMPLLVAHGWFLLTNRTPVGRAALELGLLLLLPLLLFAPWCIRNYLFTGNPVYPLFNGLFGLSGPEARAAEVFIQGCRPPPETYGIPEIFIYWKGRLRDIGFAGSTIVYLFLIIPPVAAAVRRRKVPEDGIPRDAGLFAGYPRRPSVDNLSLVFLVPAILGFLLFTYNADGRFLLPVYPVMALLVARSVETLAGLPSVARVFGRGGGKGGEADGFAGAALVLTGLLLMSSFYHMRNFHRDLGEPWFPVLGARREAFLRERYPLLPVLNALPEGSYVLGTGFPARVPNLPAVKVGVNVIEERTGPRPYSAEALDGALRKTGITHIFLPCGYPLDPAALEGVVRDYATLVAEKDGQRLYLLDGAELVD